MAYEAGYVYDLMEKGGPTDVREPYFKEAVDEMMRARTLCAKANACMPDYAVVGGVPAKVIKYLDPKEQKE
ncbi:hypothetical protein [Butyrivibrio sp. AC2005]|uniref:hypothetical protein n=1 Tax=Butyrivibrio sp. AC2005 TaxID=1280672 RepID=UPI000419B73A|nr:hypothetical protein [Butyrivibrio sp. AC2005]